MARKKQGSPDAPDNVTELNQARAQQPEKPNWTLRPADDVRKVAEEIIGKHRPDLRDAVIRYVFTAQERKSRGKVVAGQTVKLTPLQRFLESRESAENGSDFAIILDWNWRLEHTLPSRRRAQVHHQLAYCQKSIEDKNGNWKWQLAGPDVMEFQEVVEAEGAWTPEIEALGNALQQLRLPIEDVLSEDEEAERENARARLADAARES